MSRAPRRPAYLYTATNHPDVRSMIASLAYGVDISLFDPELFPLISSNLDISILRYEDAKDESAVRQLTYVQKYIDEEYPQELERERLLSARQRARQARPPPFTKDELDQEIEAVLDGERKKYTKPQLDMIVEGLKRRRDEALAEEDYDEAELAKNCANEMIRESEFFYAVKIQEEKVDELKVKLEESRKSLHDLKSRWRAVLQNFQRQRDAELQEMYESNMRKLEDLERLKDEPPPPKFRKYSPQLLNMRIREKAMVTSKMYDEASVLQEEANRIQAVEDERNRQEWHANVDDQSQKLAEKLNKALSVRETNLAKEENNMRRQMRKELTSAERQVAHLEKAIEDSRSAIMMPGEEDKDLNQTTKSRTTKSRGVTPRSSLPSLNLTNCAATTPHSPKTFRQRRILNMQIYTRRPEPKSARRAK